MKVEYNLNVNSGSMPIAWSLEDSDVRALEHYDIDTTFVVIDVFYGTSTTADERHIVRATEQMHYLAFYRPGIARVCTALVVPRLNGSSDKEPINWQLEKTKLKTGEYKIPLFRVDHYSDAETKIYQHSKLSKSNVSMISWTYEEIEVPREYFAKKLSPLLRWWVEYVPHNYLRMRLRDECHVRRWMLFAFTLQLPLVLIIKALSLGFSVVAALFVVAMMAFRSFILGYPYVNWRLLFDKNSVEVKDLFSEEYYLEKYPKGPSRFKTSFGYPLLVATVCGAYGYYVLQTGFSESGEVPVFSYVALLQLFALAIFMCSALFVAYTRVSALAKSFVSRQQVAGRGREEVAFEQKYARNRERLASLQNAVVAPEALARGVYALPPEKRTLRLRYLHHKAQRCRPTAQ